MGTLVYSALTSLDLYVEDASGDFSWAAPDAEVHAFVNELERSVGTYLYGRRMYETMRCWQEPPDLAGQPPYVQDYAKIWQQAEKLVYSRTLDGATTPRTRLERDGAGKPAFPQHGVRVDLELVDERRFANGTTYGRYAVRGA